MIKHVKSQQDWEEKSLGAKGFTLIELLVVIVILGILAAVVIFAVSGITSKGQVSACKTQDSTVRTAIEAYDAQFTAYPASLTALFSAGFLDSDPTTATNPLIGGYALGSNPPYSLQWAGPCTVTGGMSSADAASLPTP